MANNRNWSVSKVSNMSVDRRTQIGNISATIYTCRNENKEDNLSVTRLVNGIKLGNMSMTMHRVPFNTHLSSHTHIVHFCCSLQHSSV
jgi:hypothetical protein